MLWCSEIGFEGCRDSTETWRGWNWIFHSRRQWPIPAHTSCVCVLLGSSLSLVPKENIAYPKTNFAVISQSSFLLTVRVFVFLLVFLPDIKLLQFLEAGELSPHYVHLTSVFKCLWLGLDLLHTNPVNHGGCNPCTCPVLITDTCVPGPASAMVASLSSTKIHSSQTRCPESHVSLHPATVCINSMTLNMR